MSKSNNVLDLLANITGAQALAVKIFSAIPTSIVDERAMSVVTWLNSPKRNRQSVDTVSNHLAIRNFAQLHDKVRLRLSITDCHSTCHPNQHHCFM
jgi:hypothetical protein